MRLARGSMLLLLGLAGAAAVFLVWNSDYAYAYRMHYKNSRQLTLDFEQLKTVSQGELLHAFPSNLDLFCNSGGPAELGTDLSCSTELSKWGNVEALDTVFFFKQGRMVFAKVDVPPWAHDEMMRHVMQQHGKPDGYTKRMLWGKTLLAAVVNIAAAGTRVPVTFDMSPDELGVWRLDSGSCLVVNMKAEWPLQWSTVFWMSPDIPCFRREMQSSASAASSIP